MRTDLTPYQGHNRYVRYHGRYICLNCTAYFRTRACPTQLNRMTHEGWKQVRFCPVCGDELRERIDPFSEDTNQLSFDMLFTRGGVAARCLRAQFSSR